MSDKILVSGLDQIVASLNEVISQNKAYLSEIDGAIGDGDHGINMAKGFSIAAKAVEDGSGGCADNLKKLSMTLMTKIGGSMGPLYGMFFKAIADSLGDAKELDLAGFAKIIGSAKDAISRISPAKPGDKTLMDCLVPAVDALEQAAEAGDDFRSGLEKMKQAAVEGRDSTKDMISKIGRSSRLGERSRGVLDAGSCSCCLILETLADSAIELL